MSLLNFDMHFCFDIRSMFHGFPLCFLVFVCVVCVSLNKIVKTVDVSRACIFCRALVVCCIDELFLFI